MEPGSVILRALAGLTDGSGRTVVVAGPPGSGKSALLAGLQVQLEQRGARTVAISGSFRDRAVPSAAAARIAEEYHRLATDGERGAPGRSVGPEIPPWAMPPLVSDGGSVRHRGAVLARRGPDVRPEEFWKEFLEDSRATPARPLGILVDDAVVLDQESREFLLYLIGRAHLRPIVIALALDDTLPAYALWDGAIAGRFSVDWVRTRPTLFDPRDVNRLYELLRPLAPGPLTLVRFTALLGGSTTQYALGRIARVPLAQVAEELQVPVRDKLLRIHGGRVSLLNDAHREEILAMIPEADRARLHGQVADGLRALHAEPELEERIEIAQHLYRHRRDEPALRALAEGAHLLERQQRFDEAEELVGRAIVCAGELDRPDRLGPEAELRVRRSRLLIYAGRAVEAEKEFLDGMGMAFLAGLSPERMEELVWGLFAPLRLVGPRPSLVTHLGELADRFHGVDALGAEMLTTALLVEYRLERAQTDRARLEAARISQIARAAPSGPTQAVALLTVAAALADGSDREQHVAARCLRSARLMLERNRDIESQLYQEEIEARRLFGQGDRAAAAALHEHAASTAERIHSPAFEMLHLVGLAAALIEEPTDPRLDAALERARGLADRLHLGGPSPSLLSLTILEGRAAVRGEQFETARACWGAVAESVSPAVPMPYRAEAWIRLADLELSQKNLSEADRCLLRLERPEVLRGLRLDWATWLAELRGRADRFETAGTSVGRARSR